MIKVRNKKNALITGATGYIGSSLAKYLLDQGWRVHIVVRPSSDMSLLQPHIDRVVVHIHDGTSRGMVDVVAKAHPDTVFHLASLFLVQHECEQLDALVSSNILFSTQLVEAMAINGVRSLINTGTSWQYYNGNENRPVNLYAATKTSFESILDYYIDAHGIKVTTLILFDTYGPNDPRQKLISLLWKALESQAPLAMSPGQQLIDLVHIDDVVRAYHLAAGGLNIQKSLHARYGISSGHPIKLIDLVTKFEKAIGQKLNVSFGARSYRPREVMKVWDGYTALPDWSPRIIFENAILQTRPIKLKI
jgi:nucleoside-diphosphate-sugar epimerase